MKNASEKNIFLTFATPALLLVWFMTIINGLWGYVFDGLLRINSPSITLILFATLAVLVFNAAWQRRQIFDGDIKIFSLFFLFLVYLFLATIVQSLSPVQSPFITIFSFIVLYLHIFVLWISPTFTKTVTTPTALSTIIGIGAIMALIGSAQHFSGEFFHFGQYIINKIGSPNSTTGGLVRANAFFLHGDDLGVFLSFVAGVCVAAFLAAKSATFKALLLAIYLVLAVGCYSTLTRTAYLSFFLSSVVSCFIFIHNTRRSQALLAVLPLALFSIGLFVYNARFIIENLLIAFGVTEVIPFLASSASIEERISITDYYLDQISENGLIGWLFGLGWSFRSNPLAILPIDNGYLATTLSIGLIGLSFWLVIMWVIWLSVIRRADLKVNPILTGGVAFFSQFMFLNVFGTHLEPQIVMIFVAACLGTPLLSSLFKKNGQSTSKVSQ